MEFIRLLAEAFKKSKIDVRASIGSSGAVHAAADGGIAVGTILRPLKE